MAYTDKDYWNKYWEKETRLKYNFYFSDLLDRYIQWDKVKSYMEIGGAPGSVMAYMYNEHKLSVSTVDFTDKGRIESYLEKMRVENANVICEDFAIFDTAKYRKAFDIVASWGFVEHFDRSVTAGLIEKKKEMTGDGGYLIIELPNIRKLYWLLYWIFNRDLIRIHNLRIMDLTWLNEQVNKGGDFSIIHSSYWFAMNEQNDFFVTHPRMRSICKKIVTLIQNKEMSNSVKRWFYPYIVVIARRAAQDHGTR